MPKDIHVLFPNFNPLAFFLAFAIGMLGIQIMAEKPRIVVRHPTLENAGKVIQKDKNDNCYKFEAKRENCPTAEEKTTTRDFEMRLDDPKYD